MNATAPKRESFRRKLRTPALILLGLVVLDVGVWLTRDTWERYSPDDYAERLHGCRREPRDFVFIGGSPVSEGLDPEILTGTEWQGQILRSGYSMGLPGATTSETYHAAIHGCVSPPKLIVYGITASDINDGRNEPHGPASLMTWNDLGIWWKLRPKSREWGTRHFLQARLSRVWSLFRYRHGIRMWAAITADSYFPGCCPDATREARELRDYSDSLRTGTGYAPAAGFVDRRWDEVKRLHATTPPFGFLDKYKTGTHLNYLHRLLDWAEANGTTVVLLDMPTTADLDAKYADAFTEYRQRLAEVEATRRVTVLRANRDAVGLTDADFADLIHLNRVGTKKLTTWLRDRLVTVPATPRDSAAHAQVAGEVRP